MKIEAVVSEFHIQEDPYLHISLCLPVVFTAITGLLKDSCLDDFQETFISTNPGIIQHIKTVLILRGGMARDQITQEQY